MTDQTILKKIHPLPDSIKSEIVDFIEFLTLKYKSDKRGKAAPIYGSLKGTFKMADDFDAPLDDFKGYR